MAASSFEVAFEYFEVSVQAFAEAGRRYSDSLVGVLWRQRWHPGMEKTGERTNVVSLATSKDVSVMCIRFKEKSARRTDGDPEEPQILICQRIIYS